MARSLSLPQARRIALAAQGFAEPRPKRIGARQLHALFDRVQLLQLDSVNVYERSHYLPAFARLGPYDKRALDELAFGGAGLHARYVEYWAHEAALIPVASLPLFRWRMQEYRRKAKDTPDSWANANPKMLRWLRSELANAGPLAASQIEHDANARVGPWWGWSDVKRGLETLFRWGEVFSAGRTRFERRYGLAEHVLPAGAMDRVISKADAVHELVRRAAIAHGVGTLDDLADYFRLGRTTALPAVRALADAGELVPVTVEGWPAAWMHRDARVPRHVDAAALLSPFDPLVWYRPRAERLFGFHYRIEIYTPPPRRIYGYYTLPLLLGDDLVGRIDLKSDRQNQVLRVQSAWVEGGAPSDVAERAAAVVREAAAWQGLPAVTVVPRGNLGRALAAAL